MVTFRLMLLRTLALITTVALGAEVSQAAPPMASNFPPGLPEDCRDFKGVSPEISYNGPGMFPWQSVPRRHNIKLLPDGTLTVDPSWKDPFGNDGRGLRFDSHPTTPKIIDLKYGQPTDCPRSPEIRKACLLYVTSEIEELKKFQADLPKSFSDARRKKLLSCAIDWLQRFEGSLSKNPAERDSSNSSPSQSGH